MHVAITGGAGFLGVTLARAILAAGELRPAGGPAQQVERLTLLDRVVPPRDLADDPRVEVRTGDLVDMLAGPGAREVLDGVTVLVHLAAAVSGECEADFDLGMRANLDCSRLVLESARALGTRPLLVFASSIAVYGTWPGTPAPPVVVDETLPTPRGSYGTQKFAVEQLVADYTRKGFIDGRNVRLMTVSVRPGRPNAAASSFLSGIVREPLNGERAVCPVPADTRVAISSPRRTVEGLLLAVETSAEIWGPPTAFALPGLELTVAEMVDALRDVAGDEVASRIDWVPDPTVSAIVSEWASRFDSARARRLGLTADADYRDVIREHLATRQVPPRL